MRQFTQPVWPTKRIRLGREVMSADGPKRTCNSSHRFSAFTGKADAEQALRFYPLLTQSRQSWSPCVPRGTERRLNPRCDPAATAYERNAKNLSPPTLVHLSWRASRSVTEGCLISILRHGTGGGGRGTTPQRRRCGARTRRPKLHGPGAPAARHGAALAHSGG
jgi:hypothetical protein